MVIVDVIRLSADRACLSTIPERREISQHRCYVYDMYDRLALTLVLAFSLSYGLAYIATDHSKNIALSKNLMYTTLLLTVTTTAMELVVNWDKYPSSQVNTSILLILSATAIIMIWMIRRQVCVSDKDFLRDLIPSHGSTLLMAHRVAESSKNPQIRAFAQKMVKDQECEIQFIKELLRGNPVEDTC